MLFDIATTLLNKKRMHVQKFKESSLGYIELKQNRVITKHDFRFTFRDWSTDQTDYPHEVSEYLLAHQLPNEVEATYLCGTYLDKSFILIVD